MKTKVLVTGGCGFIGRAVVRQLLKKKYDVIVIDDFSNSSPFEEDLVEIIKFDLTKSNGLAEILKKADYLIHLAARVGGIKFMNSSQSQILHDNLLMDANIIKGANQVRMKKIVYASTAIVYDKVKKLPHKEIPTSDLPLPRSIYGFSKLVGERLLRVYNQDDGVNYTIARIFNIYGINPNSIPEKKLHVIPDLIRKILNTKKQLELYGGGRQKRSFVHVDDVADGLITMMENAKADGEVFNIASLEKFRVLDLAEMIWKIIQRKDRFQIKSIPTLPEDLVDSLAEVSKIEKILGWKAKKNMKESLPEIVEWYRKRYD